MNLPVARMLAEYPSTREASAPWCLRPGEATRLLAGHPWRRFVALGDSIAAGLGDPVAGYLPLPWVDRIAAELAATADGEFEYLNLGRRDLRAAEIRARQLPDAVAFRPDLALVSCGANDALRHWYDPAAVNAELAAIVTA
ncbi:MAG TPA: GDSL-type esterase/lipase family protein, partial [Micromonospora sp.]